MDDPHIDGAGLTHDEYLRHDATALAERVASGEVAPAELLALARAQPARARPTAVSRLSGPEPGDPFVSERSPGFVAGLATPVPRLRIAFSTRSPIGTAVDPQAVQAVQNAAALLASLGHQVEEAAPAIDGQTVAKAYLQLYFAQVPVSIAQARAAGARLADFELLTLVTATLGRATDAATATGWLMQWNGFARQLAQFQQRHDLWLTPTLAAPPLPHGATDPPPALRRALSVLLKTGLLGLLARSGLMQGVIDAIARDNLTPYPFTQLANLTGVPAMSVPLHWTPQGLPLGVQMIGRMGDELTLLRLAAQLEQARPWFDRLPAMAQTGLSG